MESGEEKKGFTVRDRRTSAQAPEPEKEEPRKTGEPASRQKAREEKEGREPQEELPEINFSSFILSLGTSALMNLGDVPDPLTQKYDANIPLAKQSIDMLGMLKEKTRGNLTPDEEKLIDHLLADLRWRYVRGARDKKA